MSYYDYEDLLFEYNWTGKGKSGYTTALPNTGISPSGGTYTLNYTYLSTQSDILASGGYASTDDNYVDYESLKTNQIAAVETILHQSSTFDYTYSVFFSDVAKLTFSYGSVGSSEITFGNNDMSSPQSAAGYDYYWDGTQTYSEDRYGDIWLNDNYNPDQDSTPNGWDDISLGSYGLTSVMHEIGHALGLLGDGLLSGLGINSNKYTIMSYNPLTGMDASSAYGDTVFSFGLQLMDIAAIQEIYDSRNYGGDRGVGGAEEDTTYSKMTAFASTHVNDAFIYTIWDGGGEDTIDVSGYTDGYGAILDLRQGEFSSVGEDADGGAASDNLAIAYYTVIEDAVGTSAGDTIIGNAWDNHLQGGAGDDRIFGDGLTLEDDTIIDQFYDNDKGFLGEWNSSTQEYEDEYRAWGTDQEKYSSDYSGDDVLEGGAGDDFLYGGAGQDTYIYNSGDGHDTITDDWTETNKISFGTSISVSALSFYETSGDLVIEVDASNSLTLENYVATSESEVALLQNSNAFGTVLYGTDSVDVLDGDTLDNVIFGADGDDYLRGFGGSDRIFGGDGGDTIIDYFDSDNQSSYIDGGAGNDLIYTQGSPDYIGAFTIDGGTGDDYIAFGGGDLALHASTDASGNEEYNISAKYVSINDTDGDDVYAANGRADAASILDTDGEDIIHFSYLNPSSLSISISGDDLVLLGTLGVSVTIENYFLGSQFQIEKIQLKNVEAVDLSVLVGGANFGFGTNAGNTISGNGLDNTLIGFAGNDVLDGGAGSDFLDGGTGSDTLIGGAGNDFLDGGDGQDTVDYRGVSGSGVIINMLNNAWDHDENSGTADISASSADDGQSGTDTLSSIEIIYGTNQDDYINGSNSWGNTIYGEGGDDYILGGALSDFIYGGAGNDTITALGEVDYIEGGDGDDIISGSGGNDEIYGGADDDIIRGKEDADTLYGDGGNDTIRGDEGDDEIHGGDGNDTLYGGTETTDLFSSDDLLYGDDGADVLWGLNGNDTLDGGDGNDTLLAGDGNDLLLTSKGQDSMRGEAGADIFKFVAGTSTADIIKDFNTGQDDKLDISEIIEFDDENDTITDFVQITDDGTHSYLYVDQDGTDTAYSMTWVATLQNVTGLTDEAALYNNGNGNLIAA